MSKAKLSQTSEAEREGLRSALEACRSDLAAANERTEAEVAVHRAQVRALSRALSICEQRERDRIAQLLHDDVQQLLYSHMARAKLLRGLVGAAEPAALVLHLDEMDGIMERAVQMMRTLLSDLRRPDIQSEQLEDALGWLCTQMQEAYGLKVDLAVEQACAVQDRDVQALVLLLVRELLFNVVKHSGVDEARVALTREDGQVVVRVEDDGEGFDLAEVEARQRRGAAMGLASIAERLELVGGRLVIDAAQGAGVRLVIYVPAEV